MNISKTKQKTAKRNRRHKRIRTNIVGTAKRPRLSVFRSNKAVYVQLIDDEKGVTIASSNGKNMPGKLPIDKAQMVGEDIAKIAKEKNIANVVFDRGGYLYTGQVAAVAEGARKAGLKL